MQVDQRQLDGLPPEPNGGPALVGPAPGARPGMRPRMSRYPTLLQARPSQNIRPSSVSTCSRAAPSDPEDSAASTTPGP
jgi:hypothetical protein